MPPRPNGGPQPQFGPASPATYLPGTNGHAPSLSMAAMAAGPGGAPPAAPPRDGQVASPARPHSTSPKTGQENEEAELQRHITTRMAMLTRDPQYKQMQRKLANRRRSRSALYELMFVLDLALSIGALIVAQHYRELLHQFLGVNLYNHIFGIDDTVLLAALVIVIWPVVFSLFGLYQTSWLANRFSVVRAVAAVCVASLITSGFLYFISSAADRTRIFLICFTALDAALLAGVRLILRPLAARPKLRRRVLIVGTGRLAVDAAQTIAGRRKFGLELVGIVGPERDLFQELDAVEPTPDDRMRAMYQAWVNWRLGELRDVVRIVRDREVDLGADRALAARAHRDELGHLRNRPSAGAGLRAARCRRRDGQDRD